MSFTYNRSITFDHTQVPSDQTNIPMVLQGTITSLKTVGNGGHVQNANGYDIVFSTTSDGLNPINWEVVNYVATSGLFEYWLQIPTLSSSVDTVLYMCYGNSSISTDQSATSSGLTWDSNYIAVYHFGTPSTLSLNSTAQVPGVGNTNLTGVGSPSAISGLIGGAFNATGSTYAQSSTFGGGVPWSTGFNPCTLEMWVKNASSGSGNTGEAGGVGGNGNLGDRIACYQFNADGLIVEADNLDIIASPAFGNDTNWHFVAMSLDGSSNADTNPPVYFYGDGAYLTQSILASGTWNISGDGNARIAVGTIPVANVNNYSGLIDEYRVSIIKRSSDWLTSQYNNTKTGASTPTVGSEGTGATPINESISDSFTFSDVIIPDMQLGLSFNNSFTFSDSILFTFLLPGVNLSDDFSGTWGDAVVLEMDYNPSFIDTLSLSDGFSPALTMNAFADTLVLSDSLLDRLDVALQFNDSFTWTDNPIVRAGILVVLADTFTWSDLFQFSSPQNVGVTDFFIWRDQQVVAWSSVLPALTDSFSWSDSVIAANVPFWTPVNETISDTLNFNDSLLYNLAINIGLSDTFSPSDLVVTQVVIDPTHQLFQDSFQFGDGVLIIVEGDLLQFADSFTFSDSVLVGNTTSFNSYIRRYLNDEPA